MTKKTKVYVAGPMRGIRHFNFPAFDRAAESLRNEGFEVVNPAELDREQGFDETAFPDDYDWHDLSKANFSLHDAIDRDIAALKKCDAIYLLPGWENSRGARAELAMAEWMGLHVLCEAKQDILEEALQITRGDRQAQYGSPDQDFRRTAGMWNALFADFFQPGKQFKPFHIAQAMILLKMSRQLHQRKRDNWTDAAGYSRCGAICDEAAEIEDHNRTQREGIPAAYCSCGRKEACSRCCRQETAAEATRKS